MTQAPPNSQTSKFADISAYIASWTPDYRKQIDSLTNQIYANANDLAAQYLKDSSYVVVVHVPIAIAQEENFISSLELYRHQTAAPSFLILVSANWTSGSNAGFVAKQITKLQHLQKQQPNLAITYYSVEYSPTITMGSIQRHMNDVVVNSMFRTNDQSKPSHSPLQISHACDIIELSPDYVAAMHNAHNSGANWITAHTLHWQSGRQPMLDSLVAWYDLRAVQQGGYELGMAVDTLTYCQAGGINDSLPSMAWTELRDRITCMIKNESPLRLMDITAHVSPRRLHHRLGEEGAALHNMWTSGKFEIQDGAYRNYQIDGDIDIRQRNALLGQFLHDHGQNIFELIVANHRTSPEPEIVASKILDSICAATDCPYSFLHRINGYLPQHGTTSAIDIIHGRDQVASAA